MNKTVVVISSLAWAMLLSLASGAAWAAIECTAGSACRGTDGPNTMYGSRSEDRIYGKGGSDVIDATGGLTRFTVETDPTRGSTAATGRTWCGAAPGRTKL